jgi:DNA-binding transcriptional LysR family regulator
LGGTKIQVLYVIIKGIYRRGRFRDGFKTARVFPDGMPTKQYDASCGAAPCGPASYFSGDSLLKEDTYHRQIIVSECKQHGFEPNVLLSSSQIETIRGLVSKGVGISFLLDVIARKDDQIHCLHLADPIHITIGLAWKKDRYLSKAAQSFVDFMKTLA